MTDVITENGSKEELIELAALGEGYSNHPIANSIREAYGKELDLNRVTNTEEIAGHGIKAVIDGKTVLLGNEKLMKSESIFIHLARAWEQLFMWHAMEYLKERLSSPIPLKMEQKRQSTT